MVTRKHIARTTEGSSPLGATIGGFIGSLFSSFKMAAVDSVDSIIVNAGDRVIDVQKKMFKYVFITACIWAAVAFLLLSIGFFLTDYVLWPRYLVFFIVGLALLIIASVRANFKE